MKLTDAPVGRKEAVVASVRSFLGIAAKFVWAAKRKRRRRRGERGAASLVLSLELLAGRVGRVVSHAHSALVA
jgi:hypothetical protein